MAIELPTINETRRNRERTATGDMAGLLTLISYAAASLGFVGVGVFVFQLVAMVSALEDMAVLQDHMIMMIASYTVIAWSGIVNCAFVATAARWFANHWR